VAFEQIQSDIAMRVAVARLVSRYAAAMEELKKWVTTGTGIPNVNASTSVARMAPLKTPGGQIGSAKGLIVATTIPEDAAVSKTTPDISTETRMEDGTRRVVNERYGGVDCA
jgi:hypothetical protein